MLDYFKTEGLTVGYGEKPLIRDICVSLEKGKILTLIGPNGAGKSTILKTISKQLKPLAGTVYVGKQALSTWPIKQMAKAVSVVLTDRVRPELMRCEEVVAMGRYPYTNFFGRLTDGDRAAVQEALSLVHAQDLAERDFATLSDGQRQRILLARAICQEPEVMILDEPTAYLDIRHKMELLTILRNMAREKQVTVILSLHEIDLAMKLSDYLLCVKGDTISAFGTPEEIQHTIDQLYGLRSGAYNDLFGSVELEKPKGEPEVFIIAGGGFGIPLYRAMQKQSRPFATGILFQNDVDYQVAKELSDHVVSAPAFLPVSEERYRDAESLLEKCSLVLDAGTPIGAFNQVNARLLALAKEKGIPISRSVSG